VVLRERAAPVAGAPGAEQASLQRGVGPLLELFAKPVQGTLVEHDVGVDQRDIRGPRQLGAELACHRKAPPLIRDHHGAVLASDLDRAVARLPVDDDNLPGLLP
jgi:hypothetical protein